MPPWRRTSCRTTRPPSRAPRRTHRSTRARKRKESVRAWGPRRGSLTPEGGATLRGRPAFLVVVEGVNAEDDVGEETADEPGRAGDESASAVGGGRRRPADGGPRARRARG